LIALEEGLAALYILVLNFCGLLCSWLFWLIAVKNNKAWFQKFSKKLVSIFE
jgi:glucan phosphoethanolaminetransferase (alkaline phosphatase superfamily)